MSRQIILKPIITEKAESLSEKLGQYSFVVDRKANKLEIRKAIEKLYNVSVRSVNTMIVPGKERSRHSRSGVQKGTKSAYKKAIVTLTDGEKIDFFADI
jgi:large subunit ribosomal protein L23